MICTGTSNITNFTAITVIPISARALEAVNVICTHSIILTWGTGTLVNVCTVQNHQVYSIWMSDMLTFLKLKLQFTD